MKKLTLIFIFLSSICYGQTSYFISNAYGKITNDGHSESTPIPLSIFTSIALNNKDNVFFNCGEVYNFGNYLIDKDSVTFSSYGYGANPELTGAIKLNCNWTNTGNSIYSTPVQNFKWLFLNDVASRLGDSSVGKVWYLVKAMPSSIVLRGDTAILKTITGSIIGAKLRMAENPWILSLDYTIVNYNSATGDITLDRPYAIPGTGFPFMIYNQFQWVKNNDDFYYDGSTLYYKSTTTNPVNLNLKASVKDTCFVIAASGVTVKNITFSKYGKFGVFSGYASSCPNTTIQNCDFNDIKGIGIALIGPSDYVKILDCNFNRLGIMGAKVQKGPYANFSYNTLNSIGMDKNYPLTFPIPASATDIVYYNTPAVGINGNNSKMLFNFISNVNYSGIATGSSYTEIAYNKITKFMQRFDDGGAIYNIGLSNAPTTGNKIHHNFIYDCLGSVSFVSQTNLNGIYRDNFGTNDSIYNNTIYNIGQNGIYINFDNNNIVVDNNVMFGCTYAGITFNENPNRSPNYGANVNHVVTHNKILCKNKTQVAFKLKRTPAVAGYKPYINGGYANYNYVISPYLNNLFGLYQQPALKYDLSGWQTYNLGMDANSIYLNNFHTYTNDTAASLECFVLSNPTFNQITMCLDGTYYDYTGATIISITVPAWGSAIYYK